jgi:hypothetical protein
MNATGTSVQRATASDPVNCVSEASRAARAAREAFSRQVVVALRDGTSAVELAEALDVSRQRVYQLAAERKALEEGRSRSSGGGTRAPLGERLSRAHAWQPGLQPVARVLGPSPGDLKACVGSGFRLPLSR